MLLLLKKIDLDFEPVTVEPVNIPIRHSSDSIFESLVFNSNVNIEKIKVKQAAGLPLARSTSLIKVAPSSHTLTTENSQESTIEEQRSEADNPKTATVPRMSKDITSPEYDGSISLAMASSPTSMCNHTTTNQGYVTAQGLGTTLTVVLCAVLHI